LLPQAGRAHGPAGRPRCGDDLSSSFRATTSPGPLHPEFVVVEQPFEDLHRPFQFAREREVPRRIDRDPASPRVPGSRPPKDFAEPSRLPVHDGRDRSEREPIAQAPSCCLVHPGVQDVTRSVIEDLRIGVEKADRGGLFLEGRAFPQARRQAVQITRIDVAVAPSESRDDGPQFRHRDTEYGNGRAQVGLGRLEAAQGTSVVGSNRVSRLVHRRTSVREGPDRK